MRAMVAMALVALLACGSDHSESHPRSSQPALLLSLDEDPADRVVVAQVNGKAVYADCVSTQAAAHNLDREAALQECIDFELLSQAANQPELLAASRVQEQGKQELVRAFLEARYQLQGPADFDNDLVRALWDQINVPRYNHPDLRNMVFCRARLKKGMGPESPEYQTSKKFYDMLYEELKDRNDLEKNDLFAACHERYEENGVTDHKLHTFRLSSREGVDVTWQGPVFDGPERAGQVVPPFLSKEGWVLLLITEARDALSTTFEQAEPELRDVLYTLSVYQVQRDQIFDNWFKPIQSAHTIQRFPERLPVATQLLPLAEMGSSP